MRVFSTLMSWSNKKGGIKVDDKRFEAKSRVCMRFFSRSPNPDVSLSIFIQHH